MHFSRHVLSQYLFLFESSLWVFMYFSVWHICIKSILCVWTLNMVAENIMLHRESRMGEVGVLKPKPGTSRRLMSCYCFQLSSEYFYLQKMMELALFIMHVSKWAVQRIPLSKFLTSLFTKGFLFTSMWICWDDFLLRLNHRGALKNISVCV